ncbi:hypothetical protein D1AOALGA4SA_3023 [Olavius algarvensis Delta 1 endosymbiont]|nr:hypothetical protein D1AOALGA4SA_3023 [Olavius algarvensis Delta 1 endosymbiont]
MQRNSQSALGYPGRLQSEDKLQIIPEISSTDIVYYSLK